MLKQSEGLFERAAFCFGRSAEIAPSAEILTMLANVQLAFDPRQALENSERALSFEADWEEARVVQNAALRQIRWLEEGSSPR